MEEFEEQAITNATCKPKIWKRYVDDTFPVSDRDHVDDFLRHLNCQQSTIRFTMEIEKDNTIPFLDITVTRDSDGLVTTTVYRKSTHTNQYLAYDSHHPQSIKRATVMTVPNTSQRKRQLSLRKRDTCHLYLFLMVILLHLYENS